MVRFKNNELPKVTENEMEAIYKKISTPKKLGAVIKWDDYFTDSPTVFNKDNKYYMYFIAISKDCNVSGYETHLSVSDDLLNWKYIGPVFKRNNENRWDSKQCAGYAAFKDIDYNGTNELSCINGNYYISYLAGNSDGYEPDPLYMGLAKNSDPTDADGFVRFDRPILKPDDPDSRIQERRTLYKSFLFEDKRNVTGYKYVNAYNGKDGNNNERIFLAVSNDAENWIRYGDTPVIDLFGESENEKICGDPQIILIDDIYVMFFFRYTLGKKAFNTFAASRDLVNWTHWHGKPLIYPEHDWENLHAHKTWFIRANGKNHHFYCAVNDKNERFIALAVSE